MSVCTADQDCVYYKHTIDCALQSASSFEDSLLHYYIVCTSFVRTHPSTISFLVAYSIRCLLVLLDASLWLQVLQEVEGGGAAASPPPGLQSRGGPAATGLGRRAGTGRPETQVPRADPRLCSGSRPPSTRRCVRRKGRQELPRREPRICQL